MDAKTKQALDVLWTRVFEISAFTFDELSAADRATFKHENKALERAANRWLEKLYSRPGSTAEVRR
jgi:hypothetical protein